MKLIFVYGPPAVGKLTVAKILANKTGYALLHNHLLVNPIAEVFPFDNPANRLLTREFRLRIVEEAVKSNINLITTFGIAGNDPFNHITDIIATTESHGGQVCLVQLTANEKTILERVTAVSRQEHGKTLSHEKLKEIISENAHMFDTYPQKDHPIIDTTVLSAEDAARKIVTYFKL